MANIGNLASSFVATAPSTPTAGTSLVVTAGTGANFPAAPFYVTLTPSGSLSTFGTSEIVLVTAKATDTFTITRAQKSTTAKTVAVGWIVTNGIYVEDLLSTYVLGEVPSGTVNGSNTVFTTSQPFTSIEVFKNGVRMKAGGADYTVTNTTTITFVTAPVTGTVLVVNYIAGNQMMIVGSNSLITGETPTGLVNGSNATFNVLQSSYIGASLEVFVNGINQKRVTHFTETSPGTGQFTLSDAPSTGDDIMVSYRFVVATTGNADTVDGYNANATATANTLLPLDASGTFPQSVLQGNTLGYAQIVADITTASTTIVQATGLSTTVTVPAGGRRVKITAYARSATNNNSGAYAQMFIFDGAVPAGTQLAGSSTQVSAVNQDIPGIVIASHVPSAGSHTYNVGFRAAGSGTAKIGAVSNEPASILVELI